MAVSRPWDWNAAEDDIWHIPSEESHFYAARWRCAGFRTLLDFGCGIGRHAIYFAREGFDVAAFDLSRDGVARASVRAAKEGLRVDFSVADMLELPYSDGSFDCIFAYHVISHTDTAGMKRVRDGLKRLLRPGGEVFLTLCSKSAWSFQEAEYPRLDENTVIKTDSGPEKDIPHFYVDLDDILKLFQDFELMRVRHTDDCYYNGGKCNGWHYYILARNRGGAEQLGGRGGGVGL